MTNITSKGGLAIAELVFLYVDLLEISGPLTLTFVHSAPALIVAIFILFRHGFRRQLGWIYLVLLSLLRIIGASVVLYMESTGDESTSLYVTAAITSAVGTAPLLLLLLGVLSRIHDSLSITGANISPQIFRVIQLVSTVALILAIVGGVDQDGSNPSDAHTGHELSEAASILFLAVLIILAAIAVLTFFRVSAVPQSEQKLVWAALAALPFLLVRVLYTVIVSFSHPGSPFYFQDVDVYISAFMQFLMEAIVVMLFVAAGLATPKKQVQQASVAGRDCELDGSAGNGERRTKEYGQVPRSSRSGEGHQQSASRSLGDYRPSRLIRDAVSGRR